MTKILVADDEPDLETLIRQKFRQKIRDRKYEFVFAANGHDAIKKMEEHPDVSVVLSDINMPEMSGLDLLPKARAARPDVPVIMITAYGDAETKRKALEGGAEGLFTKPIDFTALRSEIETRLERAA